MLKLVLAELKELPPGGGGIENEDELREAPIDGRCC